MWRMLPTNPEALIDRAKQAVDDRSTDDLSTVIGQIRSSAIIVLSINTIIDSLTSYITREERDAKHRAAEREIQAVEQLLENIPFLAVLSKVKQTVDQLAQLEPWTFFANMRAAGYSIDWFNIKLYLVSLGIDQKFITSVIVGHLDTSYGDLQERDQTAAVTSYALAFQQFRRGITYLESSSLRLGTDHEVDEIGFFQQARDQVAQLRGLLSDPEESRLTSKQIVSDNEREKPDADDQRLAVIKQLAQALIDLLNT